MADITPTMTFQGVILERRCDACEGSGKMYNPRWAEFFDTVRHLAEQHDLSIDAVWTKYAPDEPNEPEELPCSECEGKGRVPTAEGLELLGFLRRWL